MKESKKRIYGNATAKIDELIDRGEPLLIAPFTVGELFVGVSKGTQPERERMKVESTLEPFTVLPFDENTARIYGAIVGFLERRGLPISEIDALIASVALENDQVVITRNVSHFARIRGITVEGY